MTQSIEAQFIAQVQVPCAAREWTFLVFEHKRGAAGPPVLRAVRPNEAAR